MTAQAVRAILAARTTVTLFTGTVKLLAVPFVVVTGDVRMLDPVYANAPTLAKPFSEVELGRILGGILASRR